MHLNFCVFFSFFSVELDSSKGVVDCSANGASAPPFPEDGVNVAMVTSCVAIVASIEAPPF